MKLVKMVCPNCNSPLKIQEGQKSTKCEYCHTNVILDDETMMVKHTVYSGEKNEELKNIDALIKIKEYDEAFNRLELFSKKYIYEANIWYLMIICLTKNFSTSLEYYESDIIICKDCFKKYINLETNDELKNKRIKEYHEFMDKLYKSLEEKEKEEKTRMKWLNIIFVALLAILLILYFMWK